MQVLRILAYIFKIEKGEFLEKPEIEIPMIYNLMSMVIKK